MEANRGNQTKGSKMARWVSDCRKCADCGQVFDLNFQESKKEWEEGHDCIIWTDELIAELEKC
jgi:hypothetical protein